MIELNYFPSLTHTLECHLKTSMLILRKMYCQKNMLNHTLCVQKKLVIMCKHMACGTGYY